MPIKKGNTNIGAIYKGTTQIARVYKGTKLLFENAVWLNYLFEHIYHSLIPQTVSGKTVSNKAGISKIYGNGVVENQLVQNGDFSDGTNNFTFENLTVTTSNNTLSGTPTATSFRINQSMSVIANHKYLIAYNFKLKSIAGTDTERKLFFADSNDYFPGSQILIKTIGDTLTNYKISAFVTPTISGTTTVRLVRGIHFVNGDTFDTSEIELIDLTLMFGTGNEPTTLTDNRIQALLNRGYIAYNTGSYKNSRVGEIACYTFPKELIGAKSLLTYSGSRNITTSGTYVNLYKNYGSGTGTEFNLFTNEQLTHKFFGYTEIEYNANNNLTAMHFAAQGTLISTYIAESHSKICSIIQPTEISVSMYLYGSLQPSITLGRHFLIDLTELGIDNLTAQQVFELLNDATINSLANGDTLSSPSSKITLNGLLELNGAINSHDTFEITNTAYVFTRNIGVVDMGSLNWSILNAGNFYCTRNLEWKKPANDNIIGNIICHLYSNDTASHIQSSNNYTDKTIGLNVDPQIIVRDSAYSTAADFKTAMAGIYAYLELATPQVITIPKKHLGCVDLGTLTWAYDGADGRFYSRSIYFKPTTDGSVVGNIYCERFISTSNNAITFQNVKNAISIASDGNLIKCQYGTGSDASTFKSAMAGVYLFYETENEVSDLDNVAQINAGGSITSNWFSWKKNQLSPQNNYGSTSGLTIVRNEGIFTINGTATSAGHFIDNQVAFTNGHKYFVYAFFKNYVQNSSNAGMQVYNASVINAQINANLIPQNGVASLIATAFGTGNASFRFRTDSGITFSNTEVIPQLIDLTLAFGAGNEPTDISDPRIQYIINNGYIHYDTGTDEDVNSEVLPNVEMSIKCK